MRTQPRMFLLVLLSFWSERWASLAPGSSAGGQKRNLGSAGPGRFRGSIAFAAGYELQESPSDRASSLDYSTVPSSWDAAQTPFLRGQGGAARPQANQAVGIPHAWHVTSPANEHEAAEGVVDGEAMEETDWSMGVEVAVEDSEDFISQYRLHGTRGLPEHHWTATANFDQSLWDDGPDLDTDDMAQFRMQGGNRTGIPYNMSVLNSSAYLNRTWEDVQKHYGPPLDWWGKTRLHTHRLLSFSRTSQSNCITVGGGQVPVYEYCLGCDMIAAQHCLWDMRNNVSGNVAPRCKLDNVGNGPQPHCCAKYQNMAKRWRIVGTTSALNDAMLCLKNIGCENSHYYEALEEECHYFTCDTVYVNLMNPSTMERGTKYTLDGTGDLQTAGDGLVNGCLIDGKLNGKGLKRAGKWWRKESGSRYDIPNWTPEVVELARKGTRKWYTNDDVVVKPDSFDDEYVTTVEKDPKGKYVGKTIYRGPDVGAYHFLNGKEVTAWDMDDDAILDPINWNDDTVTAEQLTFAKQYYTWKKLFLGTPDGVHWSIRHSRREDYDFDTMAKEGNFAQLDAIDYDTYMKKRPARCDGCLPSNRNSASQTAAITLLGIATMVVSSSFLLLG